MARNRSVTVEGLDQLAKKLAEVDAAIVAGVKRAVAEEGKDVRDDARRFAPRDTGALEDSIQAEKTDAGLGATVAATARHAPFVEHGTSDTPEQPFMGPAAERSRRRFPKRVEREVGAELKDVIK